jgi:N,N'-diacetyllegionaminate synthase
VKIEYKIGKRVVGDNHPCYVIAEVGSNHNNNLDQAIELIDAASQSGADAVKFQTFKASKHYSKYAPGFSYLEGKNTYDLIKSLELNREWHETLMNESKKRGIEFFSSPCDFDAVDDLSNLGVEVYKVASFDLTDVRLISHIAKQQKPVILSTGMANLSEIQNAINICLGEGNDKIILLQCTSLYPAPTRLSNLLAMGAMRNAFGVLTGYSDHTLGDHISLASVVLGATIIEKHFTLDQKLEGPDHSFAIDPKNLTNMIVKIREVEAAMGDGIKNGPKEEELEMAEKGRRSVHANKTLAKGSVIKDNDIVIKRPGYGVEPSNIHHIVGRTTNKKIENDSWISWSDIV